MILFEICSARHLAIVNPTKVRTPDDNATRKKEERNYWITADRHQEKKRIKWMDADEDGVADARGSLL